MREFINKSLENLVDSTFAGTDIEIIPEETGYGCKRISRRTAGIEPEEGYVVYKTSIDFNHEQTIIKIDAGFYVRKFHDVNYINGGSRRFADDSPVEDIGIKHWEIEVDSNEFLDTDPYYHHNMWGGKYDKEAMEEAYGPILTYKRDYPYPLRVLHREYAESIISPIFPEAEQYFQDAIPKLKQILEEETVLAHLREFRSFKTKEELEALAAKFPECYHCTREGTPEFTVKSPTSNHYGSMRVGYGTLMGFRKYLIWKDELYLWFGSDREVSLWC